MGIGIRVVVAFSVLAGGCLARLAVGGFSLAPTHMTLAAAHTGIYRGKRTSTRMSRLCAKSGALEVTDANFALEVLNHSKHIPVLVFFSAPWCNPCRMVAPVIRDVWEECRDTLRVVEICVDDNPSVCNDYQVHSIPSLLLFKDGECVETVVGAIPKLTLLNTLSRHVDFSKTQKIM